MTRFSQSELEQLSRTAYESALAWYSRAPRECHAEGMRWYFEANDYAIALANTFGVRDTVAAGIIATISPRQRWEVNKRKALEFFARGDVGAFSHVRDKCKRMMSGEPVGLALQGEKVSAFFENILDPHNSMAVTLDYRMYAAFGLEYTDVAVRKGVYEALAHGLTVAADRVKLMPHQLQAIVWLAYGQEGA